jgi:hypothetical protein
VRVQILSKAIANLQSQMAGNSNRI